MAYKFNPFTGKLDDVETGGGGGGTPGGSDTQVQYNNAGSFGGSVDLTWDDTAKELGIGGDISLDDGGTYSTTVQTVTPTANRTISFPDATGTVALVAGSNQAVQYNSAGANAGDSGLLYDATTGSLTVGGKTVTTDAPVINLSQTWNNAATTFTGLKLNVTNTASAAASNLLDLQVNGARYFSVSKGTTHLFYGNDVANVDQRAYITRYGTYGSAFFYRLGTGGGVYNFSITSYGLLLANGAPLSFSADVGHNGTSVCTLRGIPAQPVLEQRGGTNAQTFRLYNTYTDASNYERGFLQWNSNVLEIGSEGAGTGSERPVRITAATLKLPNLPTYADNAAATTGGLVAGDVYKTATGELRITV